MEITSKRHLYKFYLTLLLVNILFIGMGTIFLSASIRDNNNIGYYIFFIIVAIAIFMNFVFIKNSPKIVLVTKGLLFKNNFYSWDNLSSTELTGKSNLFLTPTECATITFKDLKSIRIFDDLYSNSAEMKYFIQEIVIDKKDTFKIPNRNINLNNINNEFFIPHKGNPIFSFRGILMWGLILAIILLPLFSKKTINIKGLLFLIPLCVFWFILNSWMMHYFEISKNFFIVKNHYYFWKKDIYSISDIKEIVFESQPKQANKLRIITKDFKTKFYLAGSLTDKNWLEMKKKLENKNIIVRNECIPEN
jgi:hypothetical protein